MTSRRILHYEIVGKLGQGGMGVVYKAHDTHLDRFVAIKVLPADKAADPEHRRRFAREARAASALQHTNIVTIHDITEVDGLDCIVMEHVEGTTLAARIPSLGLKLGETLKIAAQIAGALVAAHGKGIVHRDLKPGNVMVRPDGTVKILDFGLAKLTSLPAIGPDMETQTLVPVTEEGTVLGTVAYMSPEQAEGRAVDARSDIFSFGAVLYEMVTGTRAFQGESQIQTLSAVIHTEPDPPVRAPHELQRIITRCLKKDPDRRYQYMKDVSVELEDLKEKADSAGLAPPPAQAGLAGRRRVWMASSGLLLLAAVAGAIWYGDRGEPAVLNLQLNRFTFDSGLTTAPALSRDGKLAAYASDRSGEGNLDIYVQHTSGGQPVRLTRNGAEDYDPTFSPDGSRIAFRSERDGGGIYVIDALGGEEHRLVAGGGVPSYSPDGSKIAYLTLPFSDLAEDTKILVIPAEGGPPTQLCPGFGGDNSFTGSAGVFWSADGTHLLFRGSRKGDPASMNWWVVPIAGGEPVAAGVPPSGPVLADWSHPVAWFGNHVYFTRGSMVEGMNIFRVPIRKDSFKLAGAPQRLTSGASTQRRVSFASDGRMLFSSVTPTVDFWVFPLQKGKPAVAGAPSRATSDATIKGHGSLSADGSRLAYVAFVSWQAPRIEIRVRNLATGGETVYPSKTLPGSANPQISPDGSTIAYTDRVSGNAVVFVGPAGELPGKQVCEGCRTVGFWPDSRQVLVAEGPKKTLRLDPAAGKRTLLLDTGSANLREVQFGYIVRPSQDGRWIAFTLDVPGGNIRTYISPVRDPPPPDSEWIRLGSDAEPVWSPLWSDEAALVYLLSNRDGHSCIWAQRLDPATKRPVGAMFEVHHIHRPESSAGFWGNRVFLLGAPDKLIVNLQSMTGNLWMTKVDPN